MVCANLVGRRARDSVTLPVTLATVVLVQSAGSLAPPDSLPVVFTVESPPPTRELVRPGSLTTLLTLVVVFGIQSAVRTTTPLAATSAHPTAPKK